MVGLVNKLCLVLFGWSSSSCHQGLELGPIKMQNPLFFILFANLKGLFSTVVGGSKVEA